jgi:cytochrome P450
LIYLLADVLPQYTARKGYKGREKVVDAFKEYFSITPTLDTTSAIMASRWDSYMVKNYIGIEAMARIEGSLAFGLLDNSVPTTFWFVYEIFKRPELLSELRSEVSANALHIEDVDGSLKHIIDLADLRQNCPHLVSTFQETLRMRMKGSIVRMVTKDTLVEAQKDQQYLLKDGNLLQISAGHFNQSSELWGDDGLQFNSRRFMQLQNTSKARQGFLAFGTAPNTCPGRHFATGEIMCLVAMLILRFDLKPKEGWLEPDLNKTSVAAAVMPPKHGIMVNAIPREEFEGCDWDYRVSESRSRFNLIIG